MASRIWLQYNISLGDEISINSLLLTIAIWIFCILLSNSINYYSAETKNEDVHEENHSLTVRVAEGACKY